MTRKRAAGVVLTDARRRRLKKIDDALRELESSLLTLRDHFKVGWTNKSFRSLYYLLRLARKAK